MKKTGQVLYSVCKRLIDIVFGIIGTVGFAFIYIFVKLAFLASGDFDIHGSVIGNTITCNPGGLNMSYNDRELPYSKGVKTAVLVE